MATPLGNIDRLAILVISGYQAEDLMQHLVEAHINFTKIDSSGGLLNEPAVCLLTGLNNARMPVLLALVKKWCHPFTQYIPTQINSQSGYPSMSMIETQAGGALIYTLNVERFEQL
jgi:uncharacterized protein YaaQ